MMGKSYLFLTLKIICVLSLIGSGFLVSSSYLGQNLYYMFLKTDTF